MAFSEVSRRRFLSTVATVAGAALLPKEFLGAAWQDPVVDIPLKGQSSREKVSWKVLPFPLRQVRLEEGVCQQDGSRSPLLALSSSGPIAAHVPHQCGPTVLCTGAGRLGSAGLRTARPLRGRTLPFGGGIDVREHRR